MEDKEMCMNCKRDIPCTNYRMHTAHCARHITLCSKCNEPIPKKEVEGHTCGEEDPVPRHTSMVAPKQVPDVNPSGTRPKKAPSVAQPLPDSICQFCHLEFPKADIPDHENYCGSRTEQCPECSDYVMLKDWQKHEDMRLYHELAKKPSSEVFKRSDEKRSIQRSASGLSLRYASGLTRRPSQSNLFTYDDLDGRVSNPFGTESRWSNSKSLKNLLDETSLHQGSSYRKYSSQDACKVERSNSTTFESQTGRRNSISSRLERHNSGTFSTYKSSAIVASKPRIDHEELSNSMEMWNTSIEEQKRILTEIERQKQAKSVAATASSIERSSTRVRSVSRNRSENLIRFRSQSRNREADLISFDDGNSPYSKPKSVSRFHPTSTLVDTYIDRRNSPEVAQESSTMQRIRKESSSSYLNETNIDKKLLGCDITTGSPVKKKKDSIVDKFLMAGPKASSGHKSRSRELKKDLRFADDCDDDMGLPDLMPFPASDFIRSSKKASSQKHEERRTESNFEAKNKSYVDRYIEEQKSSASRQRRHSGSLSSNGGLLQRQDSYSNLSCLQDEINSMLATNHDHSERKQSYGRKVSSVTVATTLSSSYAGESQNSRLHSIRATALAASMLSEPAPRRRVTVDTAATEVKRETLREMLNKLRKDPMDDDLDKCDGEYFPCEFCGDPYPVEYIMRHQLSCDLNPNPVTEGNGFDYSEIARRAAANMALARE